MKYKNGGDIFPEQLLREIQKYASGQLVYIPGGEGRRAWGEATGSRKYYTQRNCEIKERYRRGGADIESLAREYGLSYETVRKIVYKGSSE